MLNHFTFLLLILSRSQAPIHHLNHQVAFSFVALTQQHEMGSVICSSTYTTHLQIQITSLVTMKSRLNPSFVCILDPILYGTVGWLILVTTSNLNCPCGSLHTLTSHWCIRLQFIPDRVSFRLESIRLSEQTQKWKDSAAACWFLLL